MPPTNTILMWSGFSNLVPPGYQLCDGTGGSPDLRDRFIQGRGAEAIGALGGANAHIINHAHGLPGTVQADSMNHAHPQFTGASNTTVLINASPVMGIPNAGGMPASHFHPLVSLSIASAAHLHSTSGNTGSLTRTLDNRPIYYALAFVQKRTSPSFQERRLAVVQGSDDADSTNGIGAAQLEIRASHTNTGGLRFQNVQVPNSASIRLAYVVPLLFDNGPRSGTLQVWGEDADNAATFSALDLPNARTKTTASTLGAWIITGNLSEVWKAFDVTAAIQEIVNRPGWASGNAMAFLLESDVATKAWIWAYEVGAVFAARLIIEYA